jgi:hypothetical protein
MRDRPKSRPARSARTGMLIALAVAVVALLPVHGFGVGALTTNAQPAHAGLPCEPEDPNCPPPPPPPPPPGGPPPPPPPGTCVPDVGPVHAWPCPVQSTEQCVYAVGGYTTCPPGHVGVTSEQVGPVATPAEDTGTIQVSPPNVAPSEAAAWKDVACAWQLRQCLIPTP